MNRKVQVSIRVTGVTATALGVVLSPIPLADEPILVPVYGAMAVAIGASNGLSPVEIPSRKVGLAIGGGLAARGVANLAFAFIPGVAAAANAVSAAVLTEAPRALHRRPVSARRSHRATGRRPATCASAPSRSMGASPRGGTGGDQNDLQSARTKVTFAPSAASASFLNARSSPGAESVVGWYVYVRSTVPAPVLGH